MRTCLLYFCIFTLLQSRYVLSGDLWLPNLSKLSSIIYSCQTSANVNRDDRKQPTATAALSVEPVNIKPQPRTPWEFGLSISGGSSKRRPRAPPSAQSLAKDQMYSRIANCVKQKLVEEYKQNSAN
ncbi:uncharacterized protein Dwil_GK28117 [Drosophila willistoni]|uniref:uncharacterized protein LOC26530119 n=1 Tax=Drosophila willistoni TaxID=7260 RepID=UPI00073293CA|nr:uncharacterized protein LOC26530119 [Drosophila willistoni]KRF98035.1 uncharacterized protein Dwil_GK28117 [Drosophila willistoni]